MEYLLWNVNNSWTHGEVLGDNTCKDERNLVSIIMYAVTVQNISCIREAQKDYWHYVKCQNMNPQKPTSISKYTNWIHISYLCNFSLYLLNFLMCFFFFVRFFDIVLPFVVCMHHKRKFNSFHVSTYDLWSMCVAFNSIRQNVFEIHGFNSVPFVETNHK